jgi:hypothetical protein
LSRWYDKAEANPSDEDCEWIDIDAVEMFENLVVTEIGPFALEVSRGLKQKVPVATGWIEDSGASR